jgi:hypothetical protein
MDHFQAVQSNANERYLLGEMTVEERESYEEHFFDCAECAAQLKAGAMFIENARSVMRDQSHAGFKETAAKDPRAHFRGMWATWALAAALFLMAVFLYQNLITIPNFRRALNNAARPAALASFSLRTSGSRGGAPLVIKVSPNEPFGLYFDVISEQDFPFYICEVRDDSGVDRFSVVVTADQAKDAVQLLVPGSLLPSGNYSLTVLGSTSGNKTTATKEISRYPFRIESR